jgi:trinucleotide repeat-containing gene 6 protein
MQHGPLQNFHLYLNHGIALCKYSTREEAQKAQIALNNCVLGNTTICCESPHDSEVSNILQHLGIPSQNLQNSSNNNIGNVTVPMVPVPWRPSSQQVPSSNPTRTNVSDAWGASTVSSASWPTSTTSSASNNSANIEANENSYLPEKLLQSEI